MINIIVDGVLQHYRRGGGEYSTNMYRHEYNNMYVLNTGMYRCVFNHKWHATHLWGQGACCCTTHAIRGRGHKRERGRLTTLLNNSTQRY